MITLRNLRADDAQMILAWRNSEEIVSVSTSQRKIAPDEHSRWVRQSIDNPNRLVQIIEYRDTPVGQVRFDRTDDSPANATISIYVLPNYQNKGVGTVAIRGACAMIFKHWKNLNEIYAFIRVTNIISQKFFTKNFFRMTSEHTLKDHYTFKLSQDEYINQICRDG